MVVAMATAISIMAMVVVRLPVKATAISIGMAVAVVTALPLVVAAVFLALFGLLGIDPLEAVAWTVAVMAAFALINIVFLFKIRND